MLLKMLRVDEVVTTGLFDEDIPLTRPTRTQRERVTRMLRRFGLASLRRRRMLTLCALEKPRSGRAWVLTSHRPQELPRNHPALGGSIERAGHDRGARIEDWKHRVGWLSPELQADHYLAASIEEIVISGRYASIGLNDAPTRADRTHARRWLKFFGIDQLRERGPLSNNSHAAACRS